MKISWNGNLKKLQVNEMARLWNIRLVKWQVDVTSWWNGKLMKWQVDEILDGWNGMLKEQQVDEMTH
jgi:hypothetical protein